MSGLFIAALFLVVVAAVAAVGKMPFAVLWLYLVASLITFLACAFDKSAARKDPWRTQESTLHVFALLGGWPGALVAQNLIRHKSRKQPFQTAFRITVALNCLALMWLMSPSGKDLVRTILGAIGVI